MFRLTLLLSYFLLIQCFTLKSQLNRKFITALFDSDKEDLLTFKDSIDQPKFGVKSLDELKSNSTPKKEKIVTTVKTRATFGSLTVDDLKKKMVKIDKVEYKPLPKRTEDLNGINPLIPLFSSIVPFVFAYYGYQFTSYLSTYFAVSFLASDVYTLQRIAIVARNIVVGLATLATTFSGVIGVGLFLLGLTVSIGVLKGELDPNKKDVDIKDIEDNKKL